MMNAQFINELARYPERMNGATLYQLRTIVARYPYFQKARLLLLCNLFLLRDPDFNTELRRSVFYLADRRELWRFVNGLDSESRQATVAEQKDESASESLASDRTLSLIDNFLKSQLEPDTLHQDGLAFDIPATTDYLATLGWTSPENDLPPLFLSENSEDSVAADSESATSDSGISISLQQASETDEQTEPLAPSEDVLQPEFLTETLARIYIKQKKYDRALAIIRSLYLNFPEKSIYFADQIRFLEKLVRINQSKKVK